MIPTIGFYSNSTCFARSDMRLHNRKLSYIFSIHNRKDGTLFIVKEYGVGGGDTIKQQIVHYSRLVHAQLIECIGQGKYHVKIGHRQKLRFSCPYPFFPFGALAFWTMPVTAAIVTDTHMAAVCTTIHMASQRCGTAAFNGAECTQLPFINVWASLYL